MQNWARSRVNVLVFAVLKFFVLICWCTNDKTLGLVICGTSSMNCQDISHVSYHKFNILHSCLSYQATLFFHKTLIPQWHIINHFDAMIPKRYTFVNIGIFLSTSLISMMAFLTAYFPNLSNTGLWNVFLIFMRQMWSAAWSLVVLHLGGLSALRWLWWSMIYFQDMVSLTV